MNKLVSIVIPIYNAIRFIPELMDCLLNQTYRDIEFVFVNDFSTDDSFNVLNEYSKKDNRIKLLNRETKGGTAVKGIEYALSYLNGDYYFYLSQDDIIDYDLIEKCLIKSEELNADVVLPNMIWYYGDKTAPKHGFYPIMNNYDFTMAPKQAFKLSLEWKIHGFMFVKMELLKKVGVFATYYNSCEFYGRKRLLYANKIAFANTNFYYRQDNPEAITKKKKYIDIDYLSNDILLLKLLEENSYSKEELYYFANKCYESYLNFKKNYTNEFSGDEKKYLINSLKINKKELSLFVRKYHFYKIYYLIHFYYGYKFCSKILKLPKKLINKTLIKIVNKINLLCEDTKFYYAKYPKVRKESFYYFGNDSFINNPLEIANPYNIYIGDKVRLRDRVRLVPVNNSHIYFGNNIGTQNSLTIISGSNVYIGNNVAIAGNCFISAGSHGMDPLSESPYGEQLYTGKEIVINDNVWIGQNVSIMSGVNIGKYSIIGAGSVVTKSIPEFSIAVGNPAKVVKKYDAEKKSWVKV